MSRVGVWIQMVLAGGVMCIGGPALVWYVTPTEEELFKRYNPELQKRSLANREKTQQDANDFVAKLKEYSKSNKPIWTAAAEDEANRKANAEEEQKRVAAEIQKRREEIKRQSTGRE